MNFVLDVPEEIVDDLRRHMGAETDEEAAVAVQEEAFEYVIEYLNDNIATTNHRVVRQTIHCERQNRVTPLPEFVEDHPEIYKDNWRGRGDE